MYSAETNLAYICSRCYRAPELIFGATDYTPQIEMWSTGCVLVEMINGNPGAGVLSHNHLKLGMMPHPEITLHTNNSLIENGVNYAKSLT